MRRSFISLAAVTTLVAILATLAALQYRWSNEVSNAESERLQATLQSGMNQFREDLHRELASVSAAFEISTSDGSGLTSNNYAQRYVDWEHSAAHSALVAGLFLWQAKDKRPAHLLQLNTSSMQFEEVSCSSKFAELCRVLELQNSQRSNVSGTALLPLVWAFDGRIPALLHPVYQIPRSRDRLSLLTPHLIGCVVVELNRTFVFKELFPELAQRYFGGPGGLLYQVAVFSHDDSKKALYQSAEAPQIHSSPDGVIPLFGPHHRHALDARAENGREDSGRRFAEREHSRVLFLAGNNPFPHPRRAGATLIVPRQDEGVWELFVKHRSGSLKEAVASLRRRNLAVSFGVLLVLAVSMAMVVIWTMRAQKLARLQMDFVAGVSHELRTPLAVIRSAAENLADGVIEAREQVKDYGGLIRGQGRRLSEMVDQILLFAECKNGARHYDLRPTEIPEIIERVLSEFASAIKAAGFTVEKLIEPSLFPVVADANALSVCLRNLVSNALKYSAANRWMLISAATGVGVMGPEIQVTVEDRGPGIEEEDLLHVFEPFYRGSVAKTSQIHGAGLGLSLTNDIARAMGGSLSVKSNPGQGCSFTLHFPALKAASQKVVKVA
jgi:signal transduction histidine kinase